MVSIPHVRGCILMACAASQHRLNKELDLQSLYWLLCTAVLIGSHPATSPSPRIWAHIRGALLVSQDRRHLFVTPWLTMKGWCCWLLPCELEPLGNHAAIAWNVGHPCLCVSYDMSPHHPKLFNVCGLVPLVHC